MAAAIYPRGHPAGRARDAFAESDGRPVAPGRWDRVLQPRARAICWSQRVPSSFDRHALPGPRHDRPLLPALRAAARVRRRVRRGAAAVRRRARSRLCGHRRRRSARRSSAWRPAICCWSSRVRHAAGQPGQAPAGRVLRDPDVSGTHERAPDGFLLAYGDGRRGRPQAARLHRRRHADDSVFSRSARSAATWTATRAPTSSPARSRSSGRSRSFRRTGIESARIGCTAQ